MDAHAFVRIFFKLDPADWHGLHTESLWAEPVGKDHVGDLFPVKNSPFYTREANYLDVVRAAPGIHVRGLDFAGLVRNGGHSTYRILVQKDEGQFERWWEKLERLGCSYEGGKVRQGMLYSVDVPDTTDVYAVYKILEEGENNHAWMFEEGRVGHPRKS